MLNWTRLKYFVKKEFFLLLCHVKGRLFLHGSLKNLPTVREMGLISGLEDPPGEGSWQPIPVLFLPGKPHGQEVPGGLQSVGCIRVGRKLGTKQLATKGILFTIPPLFTMI